MFSGDFAKQFRISLRLNEWQMATELGISLHQYLEFEKNPLDTESSILFRFQKLLIEIAGATAYAEFGECLRSDSLEPSASAVSSWQPKLRLLRSQKVGR